MPSRPNRCCWCVCRSPPRRSKNCRDSDGAEADFCSKRPEGQRVPRGVGARGACGWVECRRVGFRARGVPVNEAKVVERRGCSAVFRGAFWKSGVEPESERVCWRSRRGKGGSGRGSGVGGRGLGFGVWGGGGRDAVGGRGRTCESGCAHDLVRASPGFWGVLNRDCGAGVSQRFSGQQPPPRVGWRGRRSGLRMCVSTGHNRRDRNVL